MRDINLKLFVLILFSTTTVFAHQFPCGFKLWRFMNDDAPAEYGIPAGQFADDKTAYVGLAVDSYVLIAGRLQTCPPGFLMVSHTDAGKVKFYDDSSVEIYYLGFNYNHEYEWVDSKDGEIVPFAVDFGTHLYDVPTYFGRVKVNNFWRFGTVSVMHGVLVYPGERGDFVRVTRYQVMTCKSRQCHEPPTRWPNMPVTGEIPAPVDSCTHTWTPYNNEITINAVSAGEHDCGSTAYVGKAKSANYFFPGRIQTVGNQGIYLSQNGISTYMSSESFYLVDDPKNSYYWASYEGTSPENAVPVRTPGKAFSMNIGRVKVNGRMRMGYVIDPMVGITNTNGADEASTNFEILVCDPWPKYQCSQEWKKYNLDNAPASDGLIAGYFGNDTPVYIGRGTSKYTNGCNYDIGRIQIAPTSAAGLYYLDEWTAKEKFDSVTAEYLVQNPAYTYRWVASRDGVKVANALELKKEGHPPFYIGMTKLNGNVFVGKVKPGDGLFFVNSDGRLRSSNTYSVLVCTQPDANSGTSQPMSDRGLFTCPPRRFFDFPECKCMKN